MAYSHRNGIALQNPSGFAANQTSRRRVLGGGAAAAAALILGPSFLAACGSTSQSPADQSAPPDDGKPATGTLRISNWPLYISPGFVADFQKFSGVTVDYQENYNDDEEWFAKNKEPLSRKQDIGADLVIPSQTIAVRLHGLGWLNEIGDSRVPNRKNLLPDVLNAAADPGRRFTAPYTSGLVGLAYNKALTGRDITKIDELWDPAFKGKVSMFSDTQDALGMVMMSQGNTVTDPTIETVQKAIDVVREQKDKGQIRRFTGNDYLDDLAAGNTAVTQAYSGDIIQLQADNPDIKFVVPDSGGTMTLQTMVLPYTTQNQKAAEEWINFVWDRPNYAKLIAYLRNIPALSDMTDELHKVDPAAASNPLINPPPELLARVKMWAALTDEQTKEFTTAYGSVTAS
jgi:spermidine/putrescine transport system substrate-binding protein